LTKIYEFLQLFQKIFPSLISKMSLELLWIFCVHNVYTENNNVKLFIILEFFNRHVRILLVYLEQIIINIWVCRTSWPQEFTRFFLGLISLKTIRLEVDRFRCSRYKNAKRQRIILQRDIQRNRVNACRKMTD